MNLIRDVKVTNFDSVGRTMTLDLVGNDDIIKHVHVGAIANGFVVLSAVGAILRHPYFQQKLSDSKFVCEFQSVGLEAIDFKGQTEFDAKFVANENALKELLAGPDVEEEKKPQLSAAEEPLIRTLLDDLPNRASKLDRIDLDEHEFGSSHVEENGGIAQDTAITYISSTFLNGLVNYGTNHVAFLIGRYGLCVSEDRTKRITDTQQFPDGVLTAEVAKGIIDAYEKHAASIGNPHSNFDGDDWLVMYETSTSFFIMWFDQDVSDCSITRYCKQSCLDVGIETFDEFVTEALINYRDNGAKYCRDSTGLPFDIIVRAPKVSGWLSS